MSTSLGFYAFQPGAPGVPAASGTGVFVSGLARLLQEHPALDLRLRWLRPADARGLGRLGSWRVAARWAAAELGRTLADRSRYLLFIYPKLPVMAHVTQPAMLALAHRALQALWIRTRLTGRRIIVVVEDLPVEMAEGRATAGIPVSASLSALDVKRIRGIERTLFRSAHRLVVPSGFAGPIRQRYGIGPARFRTFRRNIYLPEPVPEAPLPAEFESGAVNFFYSGAVDRHNASTFREILRSIRNAPGTRLHVCSPSGESLKAWLHELDVPNVRYYGQVDLATHDRLAGSCDIGLILYPTDNPYYHLTPTMKYSAYLANGLAILSTDIRCVADNIRQDGVGTAMPIRELTVELMRWATRPSLWAAAKTRAEQQAPIIRSGVEMKPWIEEIAADE